MYNFENLKKFEEIPGIVKVFDGIEISGLDLPKENQVWVVKIDTDRYNFATANDIFNGIKDQFPDVPMFGIPTGVDVYPAIIDSLIKELEDMRNNK